MSRFGHSIAAGFFVLLLAACGVTAGNPGGGPKPDRLTVYGSVEPLESGGYRPTRIDLWDADGDAVAYAVSSTYGTYRITDLEPGDYQVSLAGHFPKRLALSTDTLVNFLLPLPAPPAVVRFIALGPSDFCLLWSDRSGLEAGFSISGQLGTAEAPPNSTGVRVYAPNAALGLSPADYASAATAWNDKFAGAYTVAAWNEYGESPTVSVSVPAYPADRWTDVSPPADPPVATDGYQERCLSAPRDVSGATFVGR